MRARFRAFDWSGASTGGTAASCARQARTHTQHTPTSSRRSGAADAWAVFSMAMARIPEKNAPDASWMMIEELDPQAAIISIKAAARIVVAHPQPTPMRHSSVVPADGNARPRA